MNLEIKNISKHYKNKEALTKINLTINSGIIGLLGPNGAGKSTLMRIISTIEKPSSGTILFNGTDIIKHPDAMRNSLGYLPQDFGVYDNMTPMEFLEYMAVMKSLSLKSARKRIDDLLISLNLSNVRKNMLGGFSGGMKQRVGIAQALLNDPDILIVDEPTVGLDPEERIRFRNLLSTLSSEKIIILSTHIVSDIESIADNIALLSSGNLIEYTQPENLIKNVYGKVWECILDKNEFNNITKKHSVTSAIHEYDGIHARIISENQPMINSKKLIPSLEDAFLYYIDNGGEN